MGSGEWKKNLRSAFKCEFEYIVCKVFTHAKLYPMIGIGGTQPTKPLHAGTKRLYRGLEVLGSGGGKKNPRSAFVCAHSRHGSSFVNILKLIYASNRNLVDNEWVRGFTF